MFNVGDISLTTQPKQGSQSSMNINTAELNANQIYHLVTQTLIPRPIAWVLTDSGDKNYNLAPFSYFTAITSAPPILMFSVGKKPGGEDKDTVVNVKKNEKMVIHISSADQFKTVTESAATLDHGVSEVELSQLELEQFEEFELPRLADCSVAFACSLYEIKYIGDVPQTLVFAKIESIYIDDQVIDLDDKGRVKVHADKINPLSRLGAAQYANLGDIISQARPK